MHKCTRCGSADISRVSRRPHQRVLSLLKLYPFQCEICNSRFYLFHRSLKHTQRAA